MTTITYEDLNLKIANETIEERFDKEKINRDKNNKHILSFGINYLDKVTGGITRNDLILIGAKTGAGKTQLASIIAKTNVLAGKRVHYFALEADQYEIERRIKYQMLADLYYQNLKHKKTLDCELSYINWATGKLDEVFDPLEKEIKQEFISKYLTFNTTYRIGEYTDDDFVKAVTTIQNETDLIILDHLHYVDSIDPNENAGYKKTVKKIRDIALLIEKPVIVIAHLRKTDIRNQAIVPCLEDFHGSSDITKIATKAILIAPVIDKENKSNDKWETYFQLAKCRLDGTRTRYVGLCAFDVRFQSYNKFFALSKYFSGMETFTAINNNDLPEWAKDKKQSTDTRPFNEWINDN